MIVADTDVLIDYLRGGGAADRIALELRTGSLATTAITTFELWAGAAAERQRSAIGVLLGALHVLPLSAVAAEKGAAIHRELSRAGAGIGMADSLIAGACLERGAILITRNRKHFERVSGLHLATLP